jgi:hypothetical protein
LHALLAGMRTGWLRLCHRYWRSEGLGVLALAGSRLECPRSAELEQRLGGCGKPDVAPMLRISALVLLPAGLLWSGTVGPGISSEHDRLRQLLLTLPCRTLLVADAFYQGYDLDCDRWRVKASLGVRLSSKSPLSTETKRRWSGCAKGRSGTGRRRRQTSSGPRYGCGCFGCGASKSKMSGC